MMKTIILLTLWEQNIRMMNMNLTILMQLLPNFKMTNSPKALNDPTIGPSTDGVPLLFAAVLGYAPWELIHAYILLLPPRSYLCDGYLKRC